MKKTPFSAFVLLSGVLLSTCGGGGTTNPTPNPPSPNPPPPMTIQIVVVGETNSANLPTVNAAQPTIPGPAAGFVGSYRLSSAAAQTTFATYFGGAGAGTQVRDAFIDGQGNVFITGRTGTTGLPTTAGAFQRTFQGISDAFVAKFSATGQLVFCTYLGGATYDVGYSITVDAAGFIYVSGRTSGNFPVTAGAFQTVYGGGDPVPPPYFGGDFFIAKMRADGSGVVWATYVGGSGDDSARGRLAIDAAGNVLLGGGVQSTNFPGATTPLRGNVDGAVIKISADGSQLLYSRLLGGTESLPGEGAAGGLALNSAGEAYVCGTTDASNLPAPLRPHRGGSDAFLARLSTSGQILQLTYLGGSGADVCEGVVVDASGNPVVLLHTDSTDFATTAGAYQTARAGGVDFAVMKLSADLAQIQFSTFVGGTGDEFGDTLRLDIDASGNLFFVGNTISGNFPMTAGAAQPTFGGVEDAVIVQLSADGRQLLYSSYLGGGGQDRGRSLRHRLN